MKIYLAGPMRGYPLYNFPAFFKAAIHLRALGHIVVNPAEMDMAKGLNPSLPLDDPQQIPFDMGAILKEDFEEILHNTEAIAFLPLWEDSSGAKAEFVVGNYSGKKLYTYDEDNLADPLTPIDLKPKITFSENPHRLWNSLPGVKSIKLSLVDMGGEEADVMVDVIDSETGETLYTFGRLTLENGGQFVSIKLDAEVEIIENAELPPEAGKLLPSIYRASHEPTAPVMPEVEIEEEV